MDVDNLYKICAVGDPQKIKQVIKQHGVNTTVYDGNTILHYAVYFGHSQMVIILLKHGADVNSRGLFGNTPLHTAAEYGDDIKIVQNLLEHGADFTIKNEDQETAYDVASNEEIKFLLKSYEMEMDIKEPAEE